MNPIEGVTYWYDAATRTWKATGRPDIPVTTSGTGWGTGPYGQAPYGT